VEFDQGSEEVYAIPLTAMALDPSAEFPAAAVLGILDPFLPNHRLCDASWDPSFRLALLRLLRTKGNLPWGEGELLANPLASALSGSPEKPDMSSRLLAGEQSNTAYTFGDRHFLKLYRRLDEAVNPEPEMLRFLQEAGFGGIPAFQSDWVWQRPGKPPVAVALLQGMVVAGENGWEYVLKNLEPFPAIGGGASDLPAELREWIELLARRTGELHGSLGSRPDGPDFAPESLAPADLTEFFGKAAALLEQSLGDGAGTLDSASGDTAVLRAARARLPRLRSFLTGDFPADLGRKIRVHGDYHLGQVLRGKDSLWILDFEGEPSRDAKERRQKHSPLRDAAGMLRSFHYAAHAAARAAPNPPDMERVEALYRGLCGPFLEAYYAALSGSNLLPRNPADRDALLRLFQLEKAGYELFYELNNRPAWAGIPLRGLCALAEET
jgi:trehalose synthase-fused probable maltokinase